MSLWDKAKEAAEAAQDAVRMTLDNKFDVVQTAKDLKDKYDDDKNDSSKK